MQNCKIFLGPMSKNIVDTVIEYSAPIESSHCQNKNPADKITKGITIIAPLKYPVTNTKIMIEKSIKKSLKIIKKGLK